MSLSERPCIRGIVALLLVAATTGSAAESVAAWRVVDGDKGCVLASSAVAINDGYLDITVQLRFADGGLRALTPSNIDLQGEDLGLFVDGDERFAIASVEGQTHVLLAGQVDDIGEHFVHGREAVLRLRFWPSWPITGTKSAAFSLIGFTKAWKQYQECR